MERLAAFDEGFHPIPELAPARGEPLPEGVYTLVCKVLVQHADGTYLITRRSPEKKFGAGMWEASAGGCAQFGEDGETCIRRELREETGITAGRVTELSRTCISEMRSFFVEYLAETDWEKDSVTLQPEETVDYRWVTKEEILNMTGEELATPKVKDYLRTL